MGRFASTVEFYARYREPYPDEYFVALAAALRLTGKEHLLDVGCGPAPLALGLAPWSATLTGVDPEEGMLDAARKAAAEAHVALRLVHGKIEDFDGSEHFDAVTIGRALHWLHPEKTRAVLERLVSPGGRIAICGVRTLTDESPWMSVYVETRRRWSSDPNDSRYGTNGEEWFAGSAFTLVENLAMRQSRMVSVDELIGRAFSRSVTSPEVIGNRREEFVREIRAVLEPFANAGQLVEENEALATIFGRSQDEPTEIRKA